MAILSFTWKTLCVPPIWQIWAPGDNSPAPFILTSSLIILLLRSSGLFWSGLWLEVVVLKYQDALVVSSWEQEVPRKKSCQCDCFHAISHIALQTWKSKYGPKWRQMFASVFSKSHGAECIAKAGWLMGRRIWKWKLLQYRRCESDCGNNRPFILTSLVCKFWNKFGKQED